MLCGLMPLVGEYVLYAMLRLRLSVVVVVDESHLFILVWKNTIA